LTKREFAKPIPHEDAAEYDVMTRPVAEPFVRIVPSRTKRIYLGLKYFNMNIRGAIDKCFLRKEAAKRLEDAAAALPEGYSLLIFDAWRPLAVQKELYRIYKERIEKLYADADEKELEHIIRNFIAYPSEDTMRPPRHMTGGAVDLTVTGPGGILLDMGCDFDEFTEVAHTDWFERQGGELSTAGMNRRLLFSVMTEAGFCNLPTEWWHFEYGTVLWGFRKGEPARYTGVFTEDEVKALAVD